MSQDAERADALAQAARNLTAEPSHPAFQILFDKDPWFAVQRLSTIPRVPASDNVNVLVHRIEFAAYYYRTDQNEGEGLQSALDALRNLTRSDHWWIRRYAAEMVRRYDAFRTPDLLEAIRNAPVAAVATTVDVPFRAGMSEDEFREWKKTHPGATGRY